MSDELRLRRQGQPRGGSASQVAQAYGATQARAVPGAKIAAESTKDAKKNSASVANWPLWAAAISLLGGGVAMGVLLGGPMPASQLPRTVVSVVQPAQAAVRPSQVPVQTANTEVLLQLPKGWDPTSRGDQEEQRPALAPPPPPILPGAPLEAAMPAAPIELPVPLQITETPKPVVAPQPQQVAALPAPAAPPAVPKPAPQVKQAALPLPPPSLVPADPNGAPLPGTERWRQLAVAMPEDAKPPFIAIVIDDMGLDRRNSARAVNIAAPLTLSFMSYAPDLAEQSAAARARGHEIMLHLPMEPLDAKRNDPGPNALFVGMEEAELRRRLAWSLDRFDSYAGVNNHMGSRFTADPRGMAIVLDELQKRGRFWLDSHTGPHSAGLPLAAKRGLAATGRDLFIDDERQGGGVAAQLAALERIARANGDAIGIGHPHGATLEALERWTATAKSRGFSLVPVSTILRNRQTDRIASN